MAFRGALAASPEPCQLRSKLHLPKLRLLRQSRAPWLAKCTHLVNISRVLTLALLFVCRCQMMAPLLKCSRACGMELGSLMRSK